MPSAHALVDILVAEKLLSAEQASAVLSESLTLNRSVTDILLQKQFVGPMDIEKARAKLLGVDFAELKNRTIPSEVLALIPESVARRYNAIPFELDTKTNELSVAMSEPSNLDVIEFLRRKSGKQIKPYLAKSEEILTALGEQYAQSLSAEVTAAMKESSKPLVRTIEASQLSEIIREAPIAKIVSTLLDFAMRSRASDIHIEPLSTKTRVRYRIDGLLHERLVLPKGVHDAVVSRIKILSNLKIDEKRIPQDGRFNFKLGADEVDLRVSTLPTVHGEKVVMRLLKKSGGIPSLDMLGLRGTALRTLEANILRPHGIILVTGPTGSGKTTTLYSILSKLNTTKVNIVTLEDPVEYEIPGTNQVLINPSAGLTFANGLRAFLRQDPNIILVGEVRDSETTSLAIQAALTGHLVFSTLHTNNAATAIPRLIDLKAENFLVVSSLNCVLAQRIARKICSSCKESYVPTAEVVGDIQKVLGPLAPKSITLFKGKGCNECNHTGYLGRIGIFEILAISEKIARLILENSTAGDIEKQAIAEGMITMKQDGYLKVTEGNTTIEEVLRIAQD